MKLSFKNIFCQVNSGMASADRLRICSSRTKGTAEKTARLRQEFLPQLRSYPHLKIIPINAPYSLLQVILVGESSDETVL
jgi:hypothetical protein